MSEEPREHVIELPGRPRAVLGLVARTADDWGGTWQPRGETGGRLGLPVTAGLRRGWVAGELEVEAAADASGTRLRLRLDAGEYRVEQASVAVLVLAAAGALLPIFVPFYPALMRLVPLGLLLALGAWFFIVARLRNSGPEEFFHDLAERADE